MAEPRFIVHYDEETEKMQLRMFAYAGAFASTVFYEESCPIDEFKKNMSMTDRELYPKWISKWKSKLSLASGISLDKIQ